MFRDYLMFEWFKLKRQKIWILLMVVPFISVILGLASFLGNYDVLMDEKGDNGWLESWTQITLFYGMLFLPISSGIYAAMVCRTDHLNGGWKLQFSLPISKGIIYLSKLTVILLLILLMQLFLVLFYLIGGTIIHIDNPIPVTFILSAILLSWLGTFSLSSIQLWLSFKIKSFGIPLGINIFLSFLVFAAYTSKWGMLYPWAQPSFAISTPDESPIQSYPLFIGIVFITFLIFVTITSFRFKRADLEN
ncbi:ABC transporter permease [Priestia megaterium]|uniref:ABC transporter permease n=1 Tax=Priestia TaxID=2800373 RepID=UPI002E1E2481|nr:ABC transporter permease [Priestia megaterium]